MPLFAWLSHQVSLKFSSVQHLPAEQTTLTLKANPKSLCSVRAIDQSILLLKPEEELTVDYVLQPTSHQHDDIVCFVFKGITMCQRFRRFFLCFCPDRCSTSCLYRSLWGTTMRWKTMIHSAVSPAQSLCFGPSLYLNLSLYLKSLQHRPLMWTSAFDQSARSSCLRSIRR